MKSRSLFALAALLVASTTYAQGADALAKARAEFAEALHQEESRDFTGAIERYRRVQAVRDTTPVRFRIATCLAASGQLLAAEEAFGAVAAAGYAPSSEDTEVIKQSALKRSELEIRIAEVQIAPEDGKEATVRVDQKYEQSTVRPIRLEPGPHRLQVSRPGAPTKTLDVNVEERARVRLSIALTEPTPLPTTASAPATKDQASAKAGGGQTLGWIATATSAAVMATGVVLLAIRESDIASIEETCKGGTCPTASRAALESQRSRALLLGPLGWLGVGLGGAGIGVGLYGVFRSTDSKVSITYGGRF